jgi:hypothetical protein
MAACFLLGLLLTLAQVVTGSDTLAVLFPWRVSAVLVPLATTVILSRLVSLPVLPLGGPAGRVASVVGVAGLVAGGVWITVARLGFHSSDEELDLMNHVRETRKSGDVYFLPVKVPKLAATTRGALSSDFKPLPEKRSDQRVIPVDLQRFRLYTETPIYIDFKSIPYKDVELLEWYARLLQAEAIQDLIRKNRLSEAATRLCRLKVTHLVVPASQKFKHGGFKEVYKDNYYRVYRIVSSRSRVERS